MSLFSRIFGKSLNKAAPSEEQTAHSVMLKHEFASHPSRGLTPKTLGEILGRAEQGDLIAQAELFMDMEEKDGHVQAEMHKRKMAVIGLDWHLKPPHDASDTEKKDTALLEARIRDMLDVEDMIFDALDAIGHGYSCLELDWSQDKTGWFPAVKHRSPRWFTIDPKYPDKIRLRTTENLYGDELQELGWIKHVHKSRSGFLARTGIHRALAWPYLFKNYSVRDLAELLEIYGLPIKVGKYSKGATEKDKNTLIQAIMSIGHNAGGIIPETMDMEFITATSPGNSDPFLAMIDWCEATQSKVILGGTLTSSTSANGNRSLGEVHNEVRLDIRNSDARQLASTLSGYLVYPVAMLNGIFDIDRCPTWEFDTQEADDLALYAEALPKLADAGAIIPVRYINDKLKIPERENDEPILGVSVPDKSEVAALASMSRFTPEQQAIEKLAGNMPMKSPIESALIESAILAATSPEDLQERLAAVMSDADLDEFSSTLEKALFSADVMGYSHAG